MKGFLSSVPRILLVSLICLASLRPSPSMAVAPATEPAVLVEPGISSSTIAFDKDKSQGNVIRDVSVLPVDAIAKTWAMEAYVQLSTSFIPNQGQMEEQVEYYVQSGRQSLRFADDGVMMTLSETTLRLRFLNANPAVQLEGADKLSGVLNYFIGSDSAQWQTRIPTYGRIFYRDLWPGVDLAYEGHAGVLKSAFSIASGADPAQIRLNYSDADRLAVDQQGNLIIGIAGQELEEIAPLAWQEIDGRHMPVAVTYQVVGRTSYTFAFPESYDPAYPLAINFESRAAFLGGFAVAVAVDGSGGVYVTGGVESPDFPATVGAFDTSCGTDGNCNYDGNYYRDDVFVAKLNADGTGLAYATFIGGSNSESGTAIAVDEGGSAYVVGETNSTDFPATFSRRSGGVLSDIFAIKLAPDGTSMLYGAVIGGIDTEYGHDIAVDGEGAAYVTGYTFSPDFPTTRGAFDTAFSEGSYNDVYVVKLDVTGNNLAYSTFLGGSGTDRGYSIAVNGNGEAYVTGDTMSPDFPTTPGAFQTAVRNFPLDDAFVVKLDANGYSLVYSTILGGSVNESGRGIAVDRVGNAYVTGYTESDDFPVTEGAFNTVPGGRDAFVVKVNANGTGLDYAAFLGGSGGELGHDIDVDEAGSAYVTGATSSDDFPVTEGAFNTIFNGGDDAFVAKVNVGGTGLDYATFLGGSQDDGGMCVAIDGSGNAYVTISTESEDFPTTGVVFIDIPGGSVKSLPSEEGGIPPSTSESFLYAVANFEALLSEKREYIDYLSAPSFELETVPITVTAPGFDETQASELSSKLQADYERYMAGDLSVEEATAFERQASAFSRLTAVENAYAGLYPMFITTSQDVAESILSLVFLSLGFVEHLEKLNAADFPENTPFLEVLMKLKAEITEQILEVVNSTWSLAIDQLPEGETKEGYEELWRWIYRLVKLRIEDQKDNPGFADIFGDLMQDIGSDTLHHFGLKRYIELNQPILNESVQHVNDSGDEVIYQRLVHNEDQDASRQIDFLLQGAQMQTDYLHHKMEETESGLKLIELYEEVLGLAGLISLPAKIGSVAARIVRSAVIIDDGLDSARHLDYLRAASRESQTCAFNPADCRPPSSSSDVDLAITSSNMAFSPSLCLSGRGLLVQSHDAVVSNAGHDALKSERQRFLAQQVQRLQAAGDDYLALQRQVVEAINRGDIEAAGTLIPDLLDAKDELSARFAISRAPIQAIASLPETQNEVFSQAYEQLFIASNDFDANIVSFYALLMGVLVSPDDSALRQQSVDQAETVAISIQVYQDSIEKVLPAAVELPAQPKVIIETYQITGQDVTVQLVNATPALASDVRVEVADGPVADIGSLEPGESREVVLQVDQTGFQLIKVVVNDRTTDTKIVMIETGAAVQSPFAGLSDLSTVTDWVLYCSLSLICVSGLGLVLLGGVMLVRRKK